MRTLRRVLGDDPKEPRFLRTVSRHGYQFVFPGVSEEEDGELPAGIALSPPTAPEPRPWPRPVPAVLSAAAGGAVAGVAAAVLFGAAVLAGGGGPAELLAVLALVGLAVGGVGAAGVGTGLVLAERWLAADDGPARRTPFIRAAAVAIGGALGGGLVGTVAHTLGQWSLAAIFGRTLESVGAVGGGLEGVVLGGAAGLGYALGGVAGRGNQKGAARGRRFAAVAAGLCCGLAALLLTWTGRRLSGESLDFIGRAFAGSRVGLAPLARLFGEAEPGLVTRTVLGAAEGLLFGIGLVLGLTRRRGES